MKAKKSQIAFMLVGLLVVGGVSFLLGRQSAPPTAVPPTESTAPAESNGVDIKTESIDTVEEFLKGDELTALFQQVYNLVIEQEIPQEYRLQTELLYLPDLNATGKALPADYEAQYLDWRPVDEVSEQEPTPATTPEPAPKPTPESSYSDLFGDLADEDGNGIPDIMQGPDPEPGVSSDHTGDNFSGDVSSDTDHDYSGITIGTSPENPEAAKDSDGDGIPDIFEDQGTSTSGIYDPERDDPDLAWKFDKTTKPSDELGWELYGREGYWYWSDENLALPEYYHKWKWADPHANDHIGNIDYSGITIK